MELMQFRPLLSTLLFFTIYTSYISVDVSSTKIWFDNKCSYPVWPAIQPTAGKPIYKGNGFKLNPDDQGYIKFPAAWSGRIWGRRDTVFDSTGKGHCATGDCGNTLYCKGAGGAPPTTLAEITLGDQDFYDVSLVDGYNLAISITPYNGTGRCSRVGCVRDLNQMCPAELQVRSHDNKRVVACKSACSAFKSPKFCCTGKFGSPQTCKPTTYSKIFKTACPRAYSYAYDDATCISTCTGADYVITFCPRD